MTGPCPPQGTGRVVEVGIEARIRLIGAFTSDTVGPAWGLAGGVGIERRGTRFSGAPLGVGVWLPVRDVGMRLDINDPRVVAEVGREDVDRRGHDGRRIAGRGGLGGSSEAEDRGD